MHTIDITDRHKESASGDVLIAMRAEIKVHGMTAGIRIARSRRMDIFEEHILKMVDAGGGSMAFEEVSELLGCTRTGFLDDAVHTLSMAGAVLTRDSQAGKDIYNGPKFVESMERLSIDDESEHVTEKRTWFEPFLSLVLERDPGQPDEESEPLPEFELTELKANAREALEGWYKAEPDRLSEGRFLGIDEIKEIRPSTWVIDVLAVVDEIDNEWYLELYDAVTGERVPEIQVYFQEEFEVYIRRHLEEETDAVSVLCPEVVVEEIEVESEAAGTAIDKAGTTRGGLDSNKDKAVEGVSLDRVVTGTYETLETIEARKRMFKAIAEAQHEVVISVPFINEDAISDLVPIAREAVLKRGVQFLFLWGIAETYDMEMDVKDRKRMSTDRALTTLRGIGDQLTGSSFAVHWRPNDHTKWIMCDRRTLFSGSYNLLSYRPRPGESPMKIRREEMKIFHAIPSNEAKHYFGRIPPDLLGSPSSPPGEDESNVFGRWCENMRLGADPEYIMWIATNEKSMAPGKKGVMFAAICRGAEMAIRSHPESAASISEAVGVASSKFEGMKDPLLLKAAGRPGWRDHLESLDRQLRLIDSGHGIDLAKQYMES